MIAMFLPPALAEAIAIPGGEEPEALHLTLAYLGDASLLSEDTISRLFTKIGRIAATITEFKAELGGIGLFAPSAGSSKEPFYASVDAPDLPKLHQFICKALQEVGAPAASDHGFTPHVTLKYLASNDALPIPRIQRQPIDFTAISIVVAGQRIDLPFRPAQNPLRKSLRQLLRTVRGCST